MSPIRPRALLACFSITVLIALPGCDYAFADIDVTWSIDGDTSPALCDAHGIEYWLVEALGPSVSHSAEVSCRDGIWSSGYELHSLPASGDVEVNLTVVVDACDVQRNTLASTSQEIPARGGATWGTHRALDPVVLVFRAGDFTSNP